MIVFGPGWDSDDYDRAEQRPTPTGETCPECGTAIREGDQGLILPHYHDRTWSHRPWHLDCFKATIAITGGDGP